MPIYEYQCEQCGQIEEVLQKITDKPLKKCSHCSGMVHKLVSQSSFHLKGTGWYVTDYAGKSQPQNREKTTETTSKKADSGDSKSKKNQVSGD